MTEIDQLVKVTGLESRRDVIEEALMLYEWAVGEIQRGSKIASKAPSGEVTQMITTGLARVRRNP
jgi:hypothetical protein